MEEERLDKIVLSRGLASSRQRAEELIKHYGAKVNGKLLFKPGKKVPVDCELEMMAEDMPWVSRGALKLLKAIDIWPLEISGKTFMDIGASTGGFTEVLLHHEAARVFCVDVGTGQLVERIAEDPRVHNLEQTHVRDLTEKQISQLCDGCVIDTSFISLKKVLPHITRFLKTGAWVVALVKPQFEVGKANLGKNGVVRDKRLYQQVIDEIRDEAQSLTIGLTYKAHAESPILGGEGNREFLMWLVKQ
jgi:23S rRNA (cytidine1920-2'-O)/16S rRNA (cytidine1409-2'-O)-methyltransferase